MRDQIEKAWQEHWRTMRSRNPFAHEGEQMIAFNAGLIAACNLAAQSKQDTLAFMISLTLAMKDVVECQIENLEAKMKEEAK